MSTLDRYILSTFARNLALVLLTLISLYNLIEFLENVDDFIEMQAALKYYLLYPVSYLPVVISHSLPMAVLLATFATIGGLSRSCQLTAMLSGGISFARISRPLFLASLLLALLVMLANLWLVPWSYYESEYIKRTGVRGETGQARDSSDLYFRDGNRIISINHAFPAKNIINGLTIIELNDQFTPTRRIQAESARHTEAGQWLLDNAVIWVFTPETRSVASFEHKSELTVDLKRQPSEMLRLWDLPRNLAIGELLQLTTKLRNEGYDPKAYQMEAHNRFSNAAIPLVMVLIGLPFALQRGRNASFSLGIVISLIIFAVYLLLSAIFAVFGAINVLPPLIAAWSANILMALVGSWFFLRVQN